jgi:hypothetical protein
MTLYEITETLIRAANGGNYSSDMKWDFPYIESMVHQVRAQAIIIKYNGSRTMAANKTVQADWVQSHTYDTFTTISPSNEPKYLTVSALPTVTINSIQLGTVYLGSDGGTTQFKEATSKGQISTWYSQNLLNNGKRIGILRKGDTIEIYGNHLLKEFTEDAVYARPDLVGTWNYDTSKYPISEDLVPIMRSLFMEQVRPELMIVKDTVADRAANK